MSWTDNSNNEDGFRIERCTGNNCTNFAQIAQVGANVTSFNNTGLARNTRYRYRVRAFNAVGNSGYSNIAKAKTPGIDKAVLVLLIVGARYSVPLFFWKVPGLKFSLHPPYLC